MGTDPLEVLDAIRGVGFGMMLMQTLTRLHIAFAMVGAQVLGSIASVLARASRHCQLVDRGRCIRIWLWKDFMV